MILDSNFIELTSNMLIIDPEYRMCIENALKQKFVHWIPQKGDLKQPKRNKIDINEIDIARLDIAEWKGKKYRMCLKNGAQANNFDGLWVFGREIRVLIYILDTGYISHKIQLSPPPNLAAKFV